MLATLISCSKEPAPTPVRDYSVIHVLRLKITTTGGNWLSVSGRLMKDSSLNYNSSNTNFDQSYEFKVGKGDYANIDIFGQQPLPTDSVPLKYNVNAAMYLDGKLIKEIEAPFGGALDVYYDRYF